MNPCFYTGYRFCLGVEYNPANISPPLFSTYVHWFLVLSRPFCVFFWIIQIFFHSKGKHLKLKYREISFVHNIRVNSPILFAILHRTRQYNCRALCKISIQLGNWEISYGQTRFYKIAIQPSPLRHWWWVQFLPAPYMARSSKRGIWHCRQKLVNGVVIFWCKSILQKIQK